MKVNVLILSVLMSLVTSVISGGMVSQLKCYTNVEGTEMKLCQEENGFTSCFTKYNLEGQVVGRGCSDKGSKLLFEDHCETFQSKAKTENYCYCSYYLCNNSLVTARSTKYPPDKISSLITLFVFFI